jgi:hypothetical protein
MKSTIVLSALTTLCLASVGSAQAVVNGSVQVQVNAQVGAPQVATPQVAVPTTATAQVVAQPVANAQATATAVVVPTAVQLAAADDDPSEEPELRTTIAPPPLQAEVQTASPGPGHVWVAGYWRWRGNRYVWRAGSWKRPRVAAAAWVPGHWQAVGPNFVWVRGHWAGSPAAVGVATTATTVVQRPNGAVVVNPPGPGAVVVRPNGSVVVRQPGPDLVVGARGRVHIRR